MSLPLAIGLLGAFLGLATFAHWRDSRPPGLNPRLLPWRTVLVISGAVALLLAIQALTLLGLAPPADAGR